MPVPSSLELTAARLPLDSSFTVGIVSHRDARLERAVTRAIVRLEARIARPLSRRYGADSRARLLINVTAAGPRYPEVGLDESYRLEISDTQAVLTAPNDIAAIRGLETLLQLQSADAGGFFLQGARIADTPRFTWRGLLLDAGRHFEPVEVVKRTLDGMALVKLNVLHWHLSEDQGFRVESRRYPRLHGLGSDSLYYTQAQVREVVAYAADRGIRVVPEFDMPGHVTSWLVGYPALASAPGPYAIIRTWGTFPGVMDPTRETTYTFLNGFIAEMVTLFPDRYWHIGGDEVEAGQWNRSTRIQAWMKLHKIPDVHALQTHFNRRLFAILAKHHREPVGWDEILQPDLPKTAVIQSWRGTNYLVEAAKQGRRSLLSAPYYIDHMKTTTEFYLADPLPAGSNLSSEQQALILGGEACLWGEYLTPEIIDSRMWPRLAAVAERFWSPAEVRDVPDMYRRLEVTSVRLTEIGTRQEDHTRSMVRHFATGDEAMLFEQFLEYVRPVDFGGYGVDQLSPFTRLGHAARPDPWTNWRMQALATRAMSGDSAATAQLRAHFVVMTRFEPRLTELGSRVPIAQDGLPVAAVLRELARAGIDALDARSRRDTLATAWRAATDSLLRRAETRTFGVLRPVGASAVRVLLGRQ